MTPRRFGGCFSWIDSLRQGPALLPHLPADRGTPPLRSRARPGPFAGRDDFTRYLNALHEGDEALGAAPRRAARAGHSRTTRSSSSSATTERRSASIPGNFAHTMFIHEENVRVPYVIAAPGAIERAASRAARRQRDRHRADDSRSARAAGRAAHQGASLLRPEPRMALFFTDYSIGWLGLADGCWKYLYEMDSGRSRLFDVCDDPGETRDRAMSSRSACRRTASGFAHGRRRRRTPCAYKISDVHDEADCRACRSRAHVSRSRPRPPSHCRSRNATRC